MSIYKYKKLFVFIFIVFFIFSSTVNANEQDYNNPAILDEIRNLVNNNYLDSNAKVDNSTSSYDEMLKGLDPYSSYYSVDDYKQFKSNTRGKFYGVGIEMIANKNNNGIIISAVADNSPAKFSGLSVGDIIVQIDGYKTSGMSLSQASKLIRGELGTPVRLILFRPTTGETFIRVLKRVDIKINNVMSRVYQKSIAIITIHMFNDDTYKDFVDQLNIVRQKYDLQGLIIDLRDNSGGLLEAAVDITNLFLNEGQLITTIRGRNDQKMFDYVAKNKQNVMGDIPIVILQNKNSASASEVLTGCLQDYGIATVIGETSYGKALVQEVFQLKSVRGGAVKLTTGQYHTPKDRQINGVGIKPDIFVDDYKNKSVDAILDAGIKYIESNVI